MSQSSIDSPALSAGPGPRELTSRVLRRAWAEPQVRVRWICGLFLLLAALYLCWIGFTQWQHDRWLMSLPPTQALIVRSDVETIARRPVKPGQAMELKFEHAGKSVSVTKTQSGFKGEPMIGESIPIHVNPDDPFDLTIRNEPIALGTVLAGGLAMATISSCVLGLAVLNRRSVLRTWQQGNIRPATVIGSQQSALAPRSRLLRCVWADDDDDRRIFQVFVPPSHSEEVETLNVVHRPGARPLALAWFE